MSLNPSSIFADRAFEHAERTGRTVMRLTMHPKALDSLSRKLRSTGRLRSTSFSTRPSPRHSVPGFVARYRGVDIKTNREMHGTFLAEFTDGSLRHLPT